ncbi:MAG: hypothetical protein IJ718_05760 [Paludibacteraceae bacterium]|nr:hypothetical protein [Paludibacteraceae bacterium]
MHKIRFQWAQYRNGGIVYDDEACVELSDQQIGHISEYVRKGYNSCMIEDLPDGIYDMFEDAAHAALTAAIHEGRTVYEDDDEFAPQMDLPMDLLRLLPKKVLRMMDSADLFEFYEVKTWEELFEKDIE